MSFSLEMLIATLVFLLIVFLIIYLDKKTYFANKDLLNKYIEGKIESEVTKRLPGEKENITTEARIGIPSPPTDKKRDICVYVPGMKIWGIGLIVGLVIFISPILYKIIESLFIKQPEYKTDFCLRWPAWPYVVQIFGLLFIFGIFALIITAIIRIAKED